MLVRSRRMLSSARGRVEGATSLTSVRAGLVALSRRELLMVERLWRGTRRGGVGRAAAAISRLGNGLIYVVAAVVVLGTVDGAGRPVAVAAVAVVAGHLVYPWLKLAARRPRPFSLHDRLRPPLLPLDRFSFPSGHVMTLTAALTPFVVRFPAIWPGALLAWSALAWARIASAHHYPSDIAAGGALGLGLAAAVDALFAHAWPG